MAVTLASRLGATSRIFRPGSHSYGKGTLFVLPADVAKLQVRFARAIQFAGTSLRRFYKRQLQKDIRATTERRSGRLRRPVTVKRYGRRSLGEIELVESFPHTSFGGGAGPRRSGRGSRSGQYAYVVSSPRRFPGSRGGNRKFISHAKGATNAATSKLIPQAFAAAATAISLPEEDNPHET